MTEWKDSHDQYLDEWVSFPYEIKRYQEWLPVYTPFPDAGDVLAQEMFDAIEGKVENLEEYLAQIIYYLGQLTLKLNAIEYYMTKAADQMEIYLDSTKVLEIEQIHGVDASLIIGSTYNDLNNINTATLTDWQIVGEGRWVYQEAAADNSWNSICWSPELGLFCAVSTGDGINNRVMTSPDGIIWTSRLSTFDVNWLSVCWSPELSLFCAVANRFTGDAVMTSPDGINWTSRTGVGFWEAWATICWSPELGIFCVIGYNKAMTSPDGINWTLRTIAASHNWYSVCWSPDLTLFAAVGYSKIMTSPDGITWTSRTIPSGSSWWYSVCWSPKLGIFCAVAHINNDLNIMTSPNGITWTTRLDNSSTLLWNSVCWSPEAELFCAVGLSGVMTSPDGINWTPQTTTNRWNSVCWSPNLSMFAAVGPKQATEEIVITLYVGSSVLYEYEGIGWDNDSTIIKYIADWDFGKDYLIHPLITFDGTYGIYPNIDVYTKAKNTIEGSKDKISNSEEVLEDYM